MASTRASEWSWPRRCALWGGWFASTSFLVLLDGYGFVMAAVSSVIVVAWNVVRSPRRWIGWSAVGVMGLAFGLAVLVHRTSLPEASSWDRSSIGLFRSMGADLVTLVLPTNVQWWAGWAPLRAAPNLLWGDESNSSFNYLGLLILVLAVVGLLVGVRRGLHVVVQVAAVGLVALVFSLGPSLKINEIRGPLPSPVTYKSYLMEPDAAVIELPTTWLYENAPGFDMMRTPYRWVNVTRFGVLLLAATGARWLWRRSDRPTSRVAVVAVCALAVLEVAPNVPARLEKYTASGATIESFTSDVVDPLGRVVPPGTRVVFAPASTGRNDFLAAFVASTLNLSAYNAAGDKVVRTAEQGWPDPVRRLLVDGGDFSDAALDVLREDLVDAVVIPLFDLRRSVAVWPPSQEQAHRRQVALEDVLADERLDVTMEGHIAVVVLNVDRPGSPKPDPDP